MLNFWRGVFGLAALNNLAIGAIMVAAAATVAGQLNISGAGGPYVVALAGALIAAFGVGYALVAAAPAKHRGIVWMGVASKIGGGALAGLQFSAGAIPFNTFLIGVSDFAFAALFAFFLWRGFR
jgi:hypothetical protein